MDETGVGKPAELDSASSSGADVEAVALMAESIRKEMGKVVVGQTEAIEQIMVALLCEGHVLLEGVPGIAKTLIARTFALTVSTDFKRVQFTPDLMPSDIIGTNVFNPASVSFDLRKGPIFTGILLADEINRTPPKTQAALLEAMQERQVTIDGETYLLDDAFTVLATQNPIEYEGTYPLPEATLDRFMLKVVMGYPVVENEMTIMRRWNEGFDSNRLADVGVNKVLDTGQLAGIRGMCRNVTFDEPMVDYVVKIVRRTRENRNLVLGASPRASIYLMLGAKALAAARGRGYATPDDVKTLAKPVLRHRLILRPEAQIEGLTADRIVDIILGEVEVPRT